MPTYQKIQLVVNECVDGTAVWNGNPTILSSAVSVLFCICADTSAGMSEIINSIINKISSLILGTYCERPVDCTDMTACQINFLPNITCSTDMTTISMNDTRAPYYCLNSLTQQLCTNNTQCCNKGYEFSEDVQQCLCKYLFVE